MRVDQGCGRCESRCDVRGLEDQPETMKVMQVELSLGSLSCMYSRRPTHQNDDTSAVDNEALTVRIPCDVLRRRRRDDSRNIPRRQYRRRISLDHSLQDCGVRRYLVVNVQECWRKGARWGVLLLLTCRTCPLTSSRPSHVNEWAD